MRENREFLKRTRARAVEAGVYAKEDDELASYREENDHLLNLELQLPTWDEFKTFKLQEGDDIGDLLVRRRKVSEDGGFNPTWEDFGWVMAALGGLVVGRLLWQVYVVDRRDFLVRVPFFTMLDWLEETLDLSWEAAAGDTISMSPEALVASFGLGTNIWQITSSSDPSSACRGTGLEFTVAGLWPLLVAALGGSGKGRRA
jgi:hypothetical protein